MNLEPVRRKFLSDMAPLNIFEFLFIYRVRQLDRPVHSAVVDVILSRQTALPKIKTNLDPFFFVVALESQQ
jgi:hypothetical protein